MHNALTRPWPWLLAALLIGTFALIAAAVTIEVDDRGNVTINDPDQRVSIVDQPDAQHLTPSPTPATPPAVAGPVDFSANTPATWSPEDLAAIDIQTPSSWPEDADVLVLAWSESQRRMVDDFSPRFTRAPVTLGKEHLQRLPSGPVELQALWRRGGDVVSVKRHRLTVGIANPGANGSPHQTDPGTNTLGAAGFTVWPLHPDARLIHVATAGNDANQGRDPQHPVRTLARAKALVRNGFGDQLRLRAGDTFQGGLGHWTKSGRSAEHPLLVGVYGQGERPTILTDGDGLLHTTTGSRVNYVALQGLRVVAARRDPDHPRFKPRDIPYREKGISWLASGEFLHIEDCVFDRFMFHLVLQNNRKHALRDITLRRSVFTDAWSHWDGDHGGHSSGLFAKQVSGLHIEQCVFDRNGWADDAEGGIRTKFNHNLYIQRDCTDVTVTDNIVSRGASYGLQLRPGGRVTGNLFARNAQGMYLALAPSVVAHNVFVESDNMNDRPDGRRGYGLETWPIEHALIEDNLFLHKRGNADWAGAIEITQFGSWSAPVNGYRVTLRNNTVVGWPRNDGKRSIVVRDSSADVAELNNTLDRTSGGNQNPRFRDARLTLDRAAGGDYEDWLDRTRQRPRGVWDPDLTSADINQQLFEAFNADPK